MEKNYKIQSRVKGKNKIKPKKGLKYQQTLKQIKKLLFLKI